MEGYAGSLVALEALAVVMCRAGLHVEGWAGSLVALGASAVAMVLHVGGWAGHWSPWELRLSLYAGLV